MSRRRTKSGKSRPDNTISMSRRRTKSGNTTTQFFPTNQPCFSTWFECPHGSAAFFSPNVHVVEKHAPTFGPLSPPHVAPKERKFLPLLDGENHHGQFSTPRAEKAVHHDPGCTRHHEKNCVEHCLQEAACAPALLSSNPSRRTHHHFQDQNNHYFG